MSDILARPFDERRFIVIESSEPNQRSPNHSGEQLQRLRSLGYGHVRVYGCNLSRPPQIYKSLKSLNTKKSSWKNSKARFARRKGIYNCLKLRIEH